MKRAAVLLIALLAFNAPSAHAQSEDVWTAPGGRFSIAFRALGWTELALPEDDPGTVLSIEHAAFQQSGRMRSCFSSERREIVPDDGRMTQENLNAMTAAIGRRGLEDVLGMAALRGETTIVDGVAVVDAVFEGPPLTYLRIFYIEDGGDLTQIMISCGATAPVDAEVEANITALMQTLRIHPE